MPAIAPPNRPPAFYPLLNFVLMMAGWWICVLSPGQGWVVQPWLAAAVCLGIHFRMVPDRVGEAWVVLVCAFAGSLIDSMLGALGVFVFPTGRWWAPGWLICLWLLFGASLRHAYGGLRRRTWLAALVGALAAPISYGAGVRFHALAMPNPALAVALLACIWACFLPLALHWAHRRAAPRPVGMV